MSSQLGPISTYFNDYFLSHTPKDETILKPVERARTARFMDYAGNIPVLGMASGLIRIIGSLAIGMIACIGKVLTKEGTAFKYWEHLKVRAKDESVRGALEFVAFGILKCILDSEANQMEKNSSGMLQPFCYGDYAYFKQGMYFYSNTRFEGNANVDDDRLYDEGITLQFDAAAVEAAKNGYQELH